MYIDVYSNIYAFIDEIDKWNKSRKMEMMQVARCDHAGIIVESITSKRTWESTTWAAHLGGALGRRSRLLGQRASAAESTTWAAHLGGGIDSTRKSEAGNAATNENRIEC